MKLVTIAGGLGLLFTLSACDPQVNAALISDTPAPAGQFAEAQKAAAICGDTAPAWDQAAQALKAAGFADTGDLRLQQIARAQNVTILEKVGQNVVVMLGNKGNEGACIVGLRGMTATQSFALAQPWVKDFRAETNEARGQGLANNAVQAWGIIEDDRIVFIAAYKTWNVLEGPGAAARLLYRVKP